MTQEALKIALDALETELSIDWTNNDEFNASAEKMYKAITAIKEALTTPSQRTWVGLTSEEIWDEWIEQSIPERNTHNFVAAFARAIEAKLKELNT
jgi:hypothetical protein